MNMQINEWCEYFVLCPRQYLELRNGVGGLGAWLVRCGAFHLCLQRSARRRARATAAWCWQNYVQNVKFMCFNGQVPEFITHSLSCEWMWRWTGDYFTTSASAHPFGNHLLFTKGCSSNAHSFTLKLEKKSAFVPTCWVRSFLLILPRWPSFRQRGRRSRGEQQPLRPLQRDLREARVPEP